MKIAKLVLIGALLAAEASFGAMVVYPQKGQSAKQQQKDEGECYSWAKQQTGVDPEALASQPGGPQAQPRSNAARGAAGGAAIGAMAGNAGAGAAAGALAGGARRRRQQAELDQQHAQAQSQHQGQLDSFNKAKMACLKGRGYSVE